jgi:hypothetical protein
MYMTLEGIFGTALDVSRRSSSCSPSTAPSCSSPAPASSSSTSRFRHGRRREQRRAHRRAVSFLLGGPSGSGVATTVTLGSVAYPLLARRLHKEAAGGLLAAGGLGAILSPPVLGAAAFLIAEFLKISYLDVIRMATIPTLPLLPVAVRHGRAGRRRFGMRGGDFERGSSGTLTRRTASTSSRSSRSSSSCCSASRRWVGVLGDGGGPRDKLPRPTRRLTPRSSSPRWPRVRAAC